MAAATPTPSPSKARIPYAKFPEQAGCNRCIGRLPETRARISRADYRAAFRVIGLRT